MVSRSGEAGVSGSGEAGVSGIPAIWRSWDSRGSSSSSALGVCGTVLLRLRIVLQLCLDEADLLGVSGDTASIRIASAKLGWGVFGIGESIRAGSGELVRSKVSMDGDFRGLSTSNPVTKLRVSSPSID
uniref:(northern house mosquito) hypothetical protein n=1 Tax=Culex pipiens TaxID=7175 RepID=A0A8D8KQF3_CULPI